MARRTFRTTRVLLNASFCMAFSLGIAAAQQAAAKPADESARSVGPSGAVVTSELRLAALYWP